MGNKKHSKVLQMQLKHVAEKLDNSHTVNVLTPEIWHIKISNFLIFYLTLQ